MVSLPPVPLETFEEKIRPTSEQPVETRKIDRIEKTDQGADSPQQCLFCHLRFENDTEDLGNVIDHMFNSHGLFLPDQHRLSDPASFLGYLATQVRVWHECLYCGTTRTSTSAIQSHMRDSGHCMLNFEKEPELIDFWERKSDVERDGLDGTANPSKKHRQELQPLSGKALGSKGYHRSKPQAIRASRVRLALQAALEPSQRQDPPEHQSYRQLARRDEMGIRNISPQQRRALVLVEKRSQKEEAIAKRAKEWTYARKANDQKHDQAYGPLSWAKGGAHNLLPR
jgi:pre-60S factor REI1